MRYHRLIAELLRTRLEQAQPDRMRALHRNAAVWLESHGLVDEAVHHALAAGEADWGARLVEQHTEERFQRGEGATVNRWLAALPADLVRARPRLSLARAIWALIGGRVDEVESLLAEAILHAELARQHGDVDRTISFAQRAVAQITEEDQLLRCLVGWNMAVAMLLQGRVTELRLAGDLPAYAHEREQLVLATGGDEVGALDALTQALALARPVGYARIFVDEGAPIVDMLGKLIMTTRTHPARAAGVPPGYLRQLVDAISRESVWQGAAVVQGSSTRSVPESWRSWSSWPPARRTARLPTSWWWLSTRSRST